MSTQIYRTGSKDTEVKNIQKALNLKLGLRLKEDGIYGYQTSQAIRMFQRKQWLVEDGEAGACTLAALFNNEKYNIQHRVTLHPQIDPTACWLAATSMLLNQSIPRSSVPAALLASDGGLLNDSELNTPVNTRKYARLFNFQLFYPQSWTASGLAMILERGPVAVNILWNETGYVNGAGSSGHMVVIGGIRGDGTAMGTTLRIYDPWPPNIGKVSSFGYQKLIANIPAYTYQIYQKK